MTTSPIPVLQARTAYLYDGTNSADLAAAISDFTVVSETPTELVFSSGGAELTVAKNGYVVAAQGKVVAEDVFANEDDFRDAYAPFGEVAGHVHDLTLTTGAGKPLPGHDE